MSQIKSEQRRGTIQLYTGNGKGKTTAALGMALRFLGHGGKVCIIQFMKNSDSYGEIQTIRQLSNVEVFSMGRDEFVNREAPEIKDVELAVEGLEKARECILSEQYDLVILDELNVALDFHLVELEQVLELIDEKPEWVEIVLTGRYAANELLDRADTVSEIKEIKHHFQKGVDARSGVEF